MDLATAVKASGNVGGLILGPFGGRMGGKEPRNADEDVSAFFRALPALVLAHPSLQVLMPVHHLEQQAAQPVRVIRESGLLLDEADSAWSPANWRETKRRLRGARLAGPGGAFAIFMTRISDK